MKKYDNYKDSNQDFLGKIPSHWFSTTLKRIAEVKDGTHDTPSYVEEEGIPFITTKDLSNGNISFENCKYISYDDYLSINKRSNVENGDIIMPMIGSIGSPIIVKTEKPFSIKNLALIKKNRECDLRYICYYLNSEATLYQFGLCTSGGVQNFISLGVLRNLGIPKIDKEEQTAIANYLDHKTTQIDTLIAKKEQFISLLQEERTAVINQAVTKGLDPKVKMKDSGIEWLGEIPEHWEVKKLKYLLKENKDSLKTGPFGSHIKNSDYIPNGNYKVYTQRNVLDNEYENGCESISEEKFDELKGFTIYEGDVLITTRGSIGRCSVFPENMPTGILHPCLIRIQINENLSLRNWIVNYINNTSLFYNNVKFNSNSTIIDVIYGYTLKEIFFPTPSIIEQKKILEFLEVKINEIDTLISKSQQEIELLKEYKTALISEVVTGKVDVRDVILN